MTADELTATTGAPSSAQRARSRHHPLLGGLLVRAGLLNQTQLDRVLALQQEIEPRPLLGQLLLDEKLVTPHELETVLRKYQRMHLLGDVLVEGGVISPAQLETALAVQRRTDGALGETLIRLGLITERQLREALAIQLGLAFVDLDERTLDPALASMVSERYARHHRALPIARVDDRIMVAMEDPTDVEVTAELQSCTGHRIEVVVATGDALERAFARAYGERGVRAPLPPARGDAGEGGAHAAPAPSLADAPRPVVGTVGGAAAPPRPPAPTAAPGARVDAIRARLDAIRQLARGWQPGLDAVEALLRERAEGRAELDRLGEELRESQSQLARASGELDAKGRALVELEAAHAALAGAHEALGRRFTELQARHEALIGDRQFAVEQIDAVLRRLRA
jgi:hypothetical protein